MTRPLVRGGFPGPGQEVFGDQVRELGRRMGLYGEAVILAYSPTSQAGAVKPAWTPGDPVRARIDPAGGNASGMRGGAIDESTTHVVTFEDGQVVTTKDRVRIEGNDWIITALRERTDELVVRVEVKRL